MSVRENADVLVINCGSSSIKYQLLLMDEGRLLAGGLLERIGEGDSRLRHRSRNENGELVEVAREVRARDHREAFGHIAEIMRVSGVLTDGARLSAIGHRVVHGGVTFTRPALVDSEVIEAIRDLIPLAPLHNPANLLGIEVCRESFPQIPQVAVFDTAFHQTMPPWAYRYAVPQDWYHRHRIRRYGFHGSSHRYVADQAARYLNCPLDQLNLITLHLGNGASAAAIAGGKCIDTSMGFTPLEGLVMGTRCGDLDAAVPLHMQRVGNLSVEGVDHALNHDAGLKALAGTNDLREVLLNAESGDEAAKLALDLYGYRIKKYLGAYYAALGKVDAVIFTGGVGENASAVRSLVCSGLDRLGIVIDETANAGSEGAEAVRDIGRSGAAVRLLAIRTNEELQIARETLARVQAPV
ncbi:acetate/propionate family kinase [Methylococcus sp. EFPC2]|uniref:acetate/propionate family kinase n=1 Tax=Methylococcus sp. EFPC2 TaxID=2812648 RepID=UPI001967C50D|nr:acetate kinase [Methylococcus sp. EFPC2]QSA97842.1 acetate kinase [Methylococcus sp. EFPC2]